MNIQNDLKVLRGVFWMSHSRKILELKHFAMSQNIGLKLEQKLQ